MQSVDNAAIINLSRVAFRAGNITPVHSQLEIPFDIKRVFYIYDIPGGASRGAHAHKNCHQFIVAASGSFEVRMTDGLKEKIMYLNQPYYGLHIPPVIWAEELNFSSGAICLVLTSALYDENDYIRDYTSYCAYNNGS